MKIIPVLPRFMSNNSQISTDKPAVLNINQNKNAESTDDEKRYFLPSFHNLGQSIPFRGKEREDGINVKKVKQKIEETKNAIAILKNSNGPEQSDIVKEAYQKMNDYNHWQLIKNQTYDNAKIEAEDARVANKRWYGSYGVRARDAKMEELYYSKERKYNLSQDDIEKYNGIIALYETNVKNDNLNKSQQIKILEDKLKELETNMDYATLYDEINSTLNSKGGIENRIAGYRGIKDEIARTFVNPLEASKNDPNVKIPSAIMLYGATGCGKTTLLDAISEQSKDYAVVKNLSNQLSSNTDSFKTQMDYYLEEARERYKTTGKRTIYLINEAEKLFCMTPEDIETSGMFLDASDVAKVEKYNEIADCDLNVNFFKSLFDTISKIPTEDNPDGAAATIFITSNYPHLIHKDLLSRDGRHGKLMKIAIKPAADEDLKEVMQFYFKKYSDLVETIKMLSTKENYADLINSLPDITNKGKEVLIAKVKDGTIVNMHIDPTCGEFKNFDQFIKGNSPSINRGAYSNARIQNIADKAFAAYLENPAVPYENHFCRIKNEWGVDITSQTYRYFNNVYEMVENPEKFKNTYASIEESILDMRNAYLDGQLSDDEVKEFKFQVKDIKAKYKELQAKSDLSDLEQKVLKQYEVFLEAIEDLDL